MCVTETVLISQPAPRPSADVAHRSGLVPAPRRASATSVMTHISNASGALRRCPCRPASAESRFTPGRSRPPKLQRAKLISNGSSSSKLVVASGYRSDYGQTRSGTAVRVRNESALTERHPVHTSVDSHGRSRNPLARRSRCPARIWTSAMPRGRRGRFEKSTARDPTAARLHPRPPLTMGAQHLRRMRPTRCVTQMFGDSRFRLNCEWLTVASFGDGGGAGNWHGQRRLRWMRQQHPGAQHKNAPRCARRRDREKHHCLALVQGQLGRRRSPGLSCSYGQFDIV